MLLGHTADADGAVALAWLLAAVIAAGTHRLVETGRGPGPAASRDAAVGAPVALAWERPVLALVPCVLYLLVGCLSPASLAGASLVVYGPARVQVRGPAGTRGRRAARLLGLLATACLAVGLARAAALAGGGAWAPAALVLGPLTTAVLAALLAVRTAQADATLSDLHCLRDDLLEKITALSTSRARLRSAQDAENRAAVLDERTRIARDIHDGVGHQLTRLLFQVRALEVTHRDEPAVVSELETIGAGVGQALDTMRSSVHALADDAEDLATGLHVLAVRGPVPNVAVTCQVGPELPAQVSRCLVAVVREALTNAARHGQARQAIVSVVEYPGFWQAQVTNDGLPPMPSGVVDGRAREGMGLRSMRERVEALGGTLRIIPSPRFKVLATVPRPSSSATTPKEPR
ncbi:two-component sensor histidine kinase [Actinomyces sp. 186855]|nr:MULTISPECIES: histidine kinase [unclassified Actinomyces]MCL3777630.1 two-component sensor histidine kinase [Actinomyces sp. AC-20-1]MCL3789450.1 two-component sensor histidine kinase [Actinomyces sp. 187325]MCL3793197.1 two-component sensor histidine kinase [Actinomyces sp. 186855]MCL3794436.1 two-component sensor histidine kinase [Actinomyces sp. 217892]